MGYRRVPGQRGESLGEGYSFVSHGRRVGCRLGCKLKAILLGFVNGLDVDSERELV